MMTGVAARCSRLEPIRVGVVDDHPLVAAALRQHLDAEEAARAGVDPAAAADHGAAADSGASASATGPIELHAATNLADGRRLLESVPLDVLVCDLQLEARAEGFALLEEGRRRDIPVLILTAFGRPAFGRAAFERGANGFLSKGAPVEEIVAAIRMIAAGGTWFSAATLADVRDPAARPTPRELEIVKGIAAGRTSDELAAALGTSARTIESHLRRMFDRFGTVSRSELAALAEREGWLSLPTD